MEKVRTRSDNFDQGHAPGKAGSSVAHESPHMTPVHRPSTKRSHVARLDLERNENLTS